jgi:hypothetical protein
MVMRFVAYTTAATHWLGWLGKKYSYPIKKAPAGYAGAFH